MFGRARHADGPLARVDVRAALAVGEVVAVWRRRHGVRLQQCWLYVKQVAYVAHPVRRHDPTGDLVNARDGDCPAALHHLLRPGLLGDERVQQNTRLPCS